MRALVQGSDLTLQTLISCGGLAVLTRFLDAGAQIDAPDAVAASDAQRLVHVGIDGVLQVFSLQVNDCWKIRGGGTGRTGEGGHGNAV